MSTMKTSDYARLGRTTWRGHVWLDDSNDAFARLLDTAERPNKGLIKAWAARALLAHAASVTAGTVWARVECGTYEDASFEDLGSGHVLNASWEMSQDDAHQLFAGLAPDGVSVQWDDTEAQSA